MHGGSNMSVTVDQIEQLFMWCSLINIVLMLFTFLVIIVFNEKIVSIHSRLFKIPKESIGIAIYSFLGIWKLFTFMFFVIPWLCLYFIM